MSYDHYKFTAAIHTYNMSRFCYFQLKEVCRNLFFEEQALRKSNKYWTKCNIAQFENSDPSSIDGIVLFEIWDANSVRRLKAIEGKLRETCSTDFSKLVTNIECQHVRTK